MKKMKKLRALQAAALVGAVSGTALIMSASTPVKAAEESCWQQPSATGETDRHLRGCAYNQYRLLPGLRPADGGTNRNSGPPNGKFDGGGGGPRPGPTPPDPGPTPPDPGPTPPDPGPTPPDPGPYNG